jgi:hypothetical protein
MGGYLSVEEARAGENHNRDGNRSIGISDTKAMRGTRRLCYPAQGLSDMLAFHAASFEGVRKQWRGLGQLRRAMIAGPTWSEL